MRVPLMSDDCCEPVMDLSALHAKQRRVLGIVLAINAATFVMVVIGSFLSRSTALLSGGLDNFGDALTYGLSLAVVGASMAAQRRVAIIKGLLIALAAVAVAIQLGWRLFHPAVPIFETMGAIAIANLAANAVSLALISPYRRGDINMSSAWECSRNDMYEGAAVILATALVFVFDAGWPDILIASVLLLLFSRSAYKVLRAALEHPAG